jgi:dCTP deaminase
MILSAQTIADLKILKPCEEPGKFRGMSYGLSHCGYDVRVDLMDQDYPALEKAILPEGCGIVLDPGQTTLIAVREHFNMPPDIAGFVHPKSSWSRRGLVVPHAVIEPGWKGYLTIAVSNSGADKLTICDGDPIAQIVFHQIDEVPVRTYSGKYQGQQRGPQGPKFE